VEAMVLSVVNLQEAFAKALLVDRAAVAAAQARGDVLGGHEALLDAYRTDVRPLCAKVRAERGAAAHPVAEHRASGYAERITSERGATAGVAGGWGR
jgi:L-rhamnose isomerase/sugar isomerase